MSTSSYGSMDLSSDNNGRERYLRRARIWAMSLAQGATGGGAKVPTSAVGVAYNVNNKPITVNTFGSVNPDVTSEVDLNTTSETDVEDRHQYEPNILERALERTICYHPRQRSKVTRVTIGLLCVISLGLYTAVLMLGPIYVSTISHAGGDEAVMLLSLSAVIMPVVLVATLILRHAFDKTITLRPTAPKWVYVALGFTWALRLHMVVFSSHPDRTAWSLQPSLASSLIPFTIVATMVRNRKFLSRRRIMCGVFLLISVFICIEPRLWSLEGSQDEDLFDSSKPLWKQILWPCLFALSCLPEAIYLVLAERELKKNKVHFFSLSSSALLLGTLLTALSAFANFIPYYGRVDSFDEFWHAIKEGAKCNYGYNPEGKDHCMLKLVVMSGCLMALNVLSFLLVSTSEGAVFLSLVLGLSPPLSAAFWQVFHYSYASDQLSWAPAWTHTAIFLVLSLALAVPAVVAYSLFARQDARQVKREQKGYSDVSSSEYDWD